MFQFPRFAHSHECTWSSTMWVAPFRDARIKTCLQFPEPFRSLPRLSSPPDSLGILRSLFVPFSSLYRLFGVFRVGLVLRCSQLVGCCAPRTAPALKPRKNPAQICESRIFRLVLLLPIEIVVHNLLRKNPYKFTD